MYLTSCNNVFDQVVHQFSTCKLNPTYFKLIMIYEGHKLFARFFDIEYLEKGVQREA